MKTITIKIIGAFLLFGLIITYPILTQAQGEAGGETEERLEIEFLQPLPDEAPIKLRSGDNNEYCGAICIIEQYVGKVYIFGTGLVAVVAVLWIIVGGYEIMFSGAMSTEVSAGKEKITQALLGLALVFLAALIMHTINPTFFTYGNTTADPSQTRQEDAP